MCRLIFSKSDPWQQISNKEHCAAFPFLRLKSLKYKVTQGALSWCIYFLALFTKLSLLPEAPVGLLWCVPILCIFLYCCSSVLCSLKHPGPGKREQKTSGDKMKIKAFNIILVHLVCFLVNYDGDWCSFLHWCLLICLLCDIECINLYIV